MTRYHVDSEVGRLHEVIIHRPGLEMRRLTPSNMHDLLFDDVLWAAAAEEEHDGFAATLRDCGVRVHYFGELLTETLDVPEAREYVLGHVVDERLYGPLAVDALHSTLASMDSATLAEHLVGGITKRELLERIPEPRSITFHALDRDALVLQPLPNHLYTRDTSCWIYDGVSVNSMRKLARLRETYHYEAIYRWHPLFADAGFGSWSDGHRTAPATVEGGDVLVLGRGALLVGMSERTRPAGVELLARRLFREGAAEKIVAVVLPEKRAFMHLDTVMTMLTEDTFTKYVGLGMLPSYTLEPGDDPDKELKVTDHAPEDMHRAIAHALGLDDIRVLTARQDVYASEREQWDDGCNFLAVRPGVVVGYERNVTTNTFLQRAGIDVLTIRGNELGRGRGGPRCMSCPIVRDGI